MTIKREKSNDARLEEIDNGFIVRYQFVEVEDGDYNYRDNCQYFAFLETALESVKAYYELPIFVR